MTKTLKNLMTYLLVFALVLVPIQAKALEDIEGHWAEDHINWAVSADIVQGYEDETYRPEGNITNVEFYRMINQLGSFDKLGDISFTDVESGTWYYEEVQKAVGAGYIEDKAENLNPNEAITRDEVARIIASVYSLQAKPEALDFTDADQITNKGEVGALVDLKILVGYPEGDFKADRLVTRAEAAKIFNETCRALGGYDLYSGQHKDSLVILHTNDVHGYVEADDDHIGYANYKNVINKIKENHDRVLVIDAGDASQGSNFASLNEGADVITVLNELGLDAFGVGNHEFDYSKESALKNYENSNFKWYASNIFDEAGNLVFDGGEVVDVSGLKVGIFGLATPETKYKADPRNTQGLNIANTIEENTKIAQDEVNKLKEAGAEVVVLVSHLGDDKSSEIKSTNIAENVTGINVIIDGHSHTLHENGLAHGNSFIASTGDSLKNIGLTTVASDGEVSSRMITKQEAVVYGEDEKIKSIIDDLLAQQDLVLARVLGVSATKLDGERNDVRTKETNLGNLITDAMRQEAGADVALTNGGGIRASIDQGSVSVGDVFTVLPFGNAMTVIEVTGQDIIDALNHGIKDYPNAAGQFPHVSGISFEIAQGDTNSAVNVKVGDADIDPAATYKLATNDFMAVGGDGYTMFEGKTQLALYGSLAKIVEDYITELTTQNPDGFTYEVQGRIKVQDSSSLDQAA